MTIVVTGGSGFIGTRLTRTLLALGDTVVVVDRVTPSFTHERLYFIQCDITKEQLPFNVLEQTDAVINLVGVPLVEKWDTEYKNMIRESRINSTRHIVTSMREATNRPTILINASATGYYGDGGDEVLTEKSPKGAGFLADVVADWEQEAQAAEGFGTRVVCIRTAPVVGHGGIVAQLTKSARFGVLFSLTKREFWQPWIHEDDIVNAYIFALQTSTLQGIINAAAPEMVTHHTFIHTLATVFHKKVIGVLPRAVRKFFFAEECIEEMTKSQRISPQRILDKGFVFTHPDLIGACQTLKNKK